MAVIGVIVVIAFVMVFAAVFNGYALSVLWEWFVVPTFGAPQLSIVSAIGIAMTIQYLVNPKMYTSAGEEKDEGKGLEQKIAEAILKIALNPLLALFFGWIVHLFM